MRKVLQPVALADTTVGGGAATVPRFQTWYAKDDFVRMWKKLYKDLGTDGRQGARAARDDGARRHLRLERAHGRRRCRPGRPIATRSTSRKLKTDDDWMAWAPATASSYSPAVMTHSFRQLRRACSTACRSCRRSRPMRRRLRETTSPTCFDSEFPVGAAVVKAQWRRAEFGAKLPTFDTTRRRRCSSACRRATATGATATAQADPAADRIHTVRLTNGNVFRLVGLHVMTKELRHWLWMTMWWSDAPTATSAPTARRRSTRRLAQLQDVHRHRHDERDPAQPAGPTWCTNPYLEKGAGNARTNCIGCHQHGGIALKPEDILGDATTLSRRRRAPSCAPTFPTDYSWALDRGDKLAPRHRGRGRLLRLVRKK